ncbi:MAG: tRNA uridine-5-carboxymethylaminomethyl(34) synthesis enzyme MnmG, partial [Deefgea sp.]
VLVDDLVSKGVTEPYRMFTSRAEFRLQLREDNADLRLTEHGRRLGLVGDAQWQAFEIKREAVALELERIKSTWVNPKILAASEAERVLGKAIEREYTLADLLRRPEVTYATLMTLDVAGPGVADEKVAEQIEIQVKYQGYIERQQYEVAKRDTLEDVVLPNDFDYSVVSGLSKEIQQKLTTQRPQTLGLASRISGVTPAALALLVVYLKKSQLVAASQQNKAEIQ